MLGPQTDMATRAGLILFSYQDFNLVLVIYILIKVAAYTKVMYITDNNYD